LGTPLALLADIALGCSPVGDPDALQDPSESANSRWLAEQPLAEDSGAETQSRFRFQHECTARICTAILAQDGVTAVVCELQEDFVVFYEDGAPELVSVKHREGSRGAWRFHALCAEGGVSHLFNRALATGPSEAAEFAKACHSRIPAQLEPWLAPLEAETTSNDREQLIHFAINLSIEADLPGKSHIGAVNLRDLVEPALKRLGLDPGEAPAVYERLVDAIATANRDAIGDPVDMITVIGNPRSLDSLSSADRRVQRRMLDNAKVRALLLPKRSVEPSLVTSELPATTPPPSRLKKKLRKGGLGPTAIDAAVELRAGWYGFESIRRNNIPGGDPAFDELRIRVQELVGLSESRMDRAGPYGAKMHLDVRDTVTTNSLTKSPPFPLDDQLLQGLVFQMTDECKVWWSAPFDLDEL
jgi:hypothetical protein